MDEKLAKKMPGYRKKLDTYEYAQKVAEALMIP
jgi:hypothetical protein